MKLHKLTMKNFMPYKGEVSVDFPKDDYRNVMIILGENMRGKTSLLNSIRWGFYGKALGRHSRPIALHEVVNSEAALEDDWRVEVELQFEANGFLYDLRRKATRKHMVATPSRPEDFTVSLHLSRNGEVLRGDQIEAEIAQFAPEQISRFFLFDGELLQEYESLLIEGSEQGRQIKEVIEQVLGVPALKNGRAEIGAILKTATKKQNQEIQHIQGLEKQAERQRDLSVRQDALERDLEAQLIQLEETRSRRIALDDDLDAGAALLAAKGRLDALKMQSKNLEEMCSAKEQERKSILAQAWRDLLDLRLEVRRQQLIRQQEDLHQKMKEHGKIQSKVSDLRSLLDTRECPTCKQEMSEQYRGTVGADLGALELKLDALTDCGAELQFVSAKLESLNKIRGISACDRLEQIDKDLQKAYVNLTRVENDIEAINDEIAEQDPAELARKRVIRDRLLQEEAGYQTSISTVKKEIEQVRDELAVAQKTIESLAPHRSQKSTIKVSMLSDLERIFATSIEALRDRLKEKVEALSSDAFRQMTTQSRYKGLSINNNYGLTIIDERNQQVPLRSAGAEQIVALSLIDGLNRIGRAIGPVIMDTPFGRLDLSHRDNILSYMPSVTSQFVLLVHSGEIRPETDLEAVKSRVGAVYSINEISPTCSTIEKASL